MSLEDTRRNWQRFGETDPMWAVLTDRQRRGNRWDPEEFFQTGEKVVREILEYAQRCGATVHHGRALDFGCGVGRLTQALAQRFESVVGIDVAESMIERAREFNRFPDSCEYIVNTTDNLNVLESDSFDFILTIIVLQHIEPQNTLKYLAEFMRALKPGGVLVFQQTTSHRWRLRPTQPPATFKERVANLLPLPVLDAYGLVRSRINGEPRMHAYGISQKTVVQHIEAHGGTVLDVTPDDWGGPAWVSHHYCVVKSPPRA